MYSYLDKERKDIEDWREHPEKVKTIVETVVDSKGETLEILYWKVLGLED